MAPFRDVKNFSPVALAQPSCSGHTLAMYFDQSKFFRTLYLMPTFVELNTWNLDPLNPISFPSERSYLSSCENAGLAISFLNSL